jgi:hypothetical protein
MRSALDSNIGSLLISALIHLVSGALAMGTVSDVTTKNQRAVTKQRTEVLEQTGIQDSGHSGTGGQFAAKAMARPGPGKET